MVEIQEFDHPTRASFGGKIGWDFGLLSFRGACPRNKFAASGLGNSASALLGSFNPVVTAIDGKVVKSTILNASRKSALHPVQAFAPGSGLVLGQAEVDGKSNEITTLPALLEMLDMDGRTAAADAMHTQREASAPVVEKGGDYVLPAEGNQKSLREDVRDWFDDPEAQEEPSV